MAAAVLLPLLLVRILMVSNISNESNVNDCEDRGNIDKNNNNHDKYVCRDDTVMLIMHKHNASSDSSIMEFGWPCFLV